VLSPRGGALPRMLTPFRAGVGGPIGDGQQWWRWITLDDLVAVLHRAILDEKLSGAVNAVAPMPVRNVDFTRALGRAVSRPAIVPLPAFAARAALGEMADPLLLASARVVPRRLQEAGFRFAWPELDRAFGHVLGTLK